MDLIFRAARLPRRGETLPGTSFVTHPGGKGGNQAAQVAHAGARAVVVGRVGRDGFGERLRASLVDARVDTTFLAVDERDATGVSTVLVGGDGDYASVIVPGASLNVEPGDIDLAADAIAGAAVVLLQLEIGHAAVTHAAKRGRASGAMVILNAAPAPERPAVLPDELWHSVDVVVVNRGEAEMLLGDGAADMLPCELAARTRFCFNVAAVIVTLGGDGVVLDDAIGTLHETAWPVDVLETIGAGDAFVGTLAAAVAGGTSLRGALALANAAGAMAVTRSDGYDALPTRSEVLRFLAERGLGQPPQPDYDTRLP